MEKRPLNTLAGIHAELLHRAWQERAAARIGRTNKQRRAEAEHAARALETLAAHIKRETALVTEHFPHDTCPDCGKPSRPLEGVPDQTARGCGWCEREWFEDLSKPTA